MLFSGTVFLRRIFEPCIRPTVRQLPECSDKNAWLRFKCVEHRAARCSTVSGLLGSLVLQPCRDTPSEITTWTTLQRHILQRSVFS